MKHRFFIVLALVLLAACGGKGSHGSRNGHGSQKSQEEANGSSCFATDGALSVGNSITCSLDECGDDCTLLYEGHDGRMIPLASCESGAEAVTFGISPAMAGSGKILCRAGEEEKSLMDLMVTAPTNAQDDVVSSGPSPNTTRTCVSDTDCLSGEKCVDGQCQIAPQQQPFIRIIPPITASQQTMSLHHIDLLQPMEISLTVEPVTEGSAKLGMFKVSYKITGSETAHQAYVYGPFDRKYSDTDCGRTEDGRDLALQPPLNDSAALYNEVREGHQCRGDASCYNFSVHGPQESDYVHNGDGPRFLRANKSIPLCRIDLPNREGVFYTRFRQKADIVMAVQMKGGAWKEAIQPVDFSSFEPTLTDGQVTLDQNSGDVKLVGYHYTNATSISLPSGCHFVSEVSGVGPDATRTSSEGYFTAVCPIVSERAAPPPPPGGTITATCTNCTSSNATMVPPAPREQYETSVNRGLDVSVSGIEDFHEGRYEQASDNHRVKCGEPEISSSMESSIYKNKTGNETTTGEGYIGLNASVKRICIVQKLSENGGDYVDEGSAIDFPLVKELKLESVICERHQASHYQPVSVENASAIHGRLVYSLECQSGYRVTMTDWNGRTIGVLISNDDEEKDKEENVGPRPAPLEPTFEVEEDMIAHVCHRAEYAEPKDPCDMPGEEWFAEHRVGSCSDLRRRISDYYMSYSFNLTARYLKEIKSTCPGTFKFGDSDKAEGSTIQLEEVMHQEREIIFIGTSEQGREWCQFEATTWNGRKLKWEKSPDCLDSH